MLKRYILYSYLAAFTCIQATQNWESRDRWQKTDEIIKAMGVKTGDAVADIGSKDGYLTIKLSKKVGTNGNVFAVDIDADALEKLQKNLNKNKLTNVTKVLSEADNPKLNKNSISSAIILNAYHEMDDYKEMLAHIKAALKTDGRLVIVDGISNSRRKSKRSVQTNKHELSIDLALKDLGEAGYHILSKTEKFISNHPWRDEQWIIVASPKNN